MTMVEYDCGCCRDECTRWDSGGRCCLHGRWARERCDWCVPAYAPVADVPVRGYKILTRDMRAPLNQEFRYEVGGDYELPEGDVLCMCRCGFHFCRTVAECARFVGLTPSTPVVEVEGSGLVLEATKEAVERYRTLRYAPKLVASRLKVLRIVPADKVPGILAEEWQL